MALMHLRLGLLQPVRHAHVAVHRHRGGEVLLRLPPLVGAPVELAVSEVTMGDERTIVARLGERQRVAEMTFGLIRQILVGSDVAEKAKYPRLKAALPALAGNGQPAL